MLILATAALAEVRAERIDPVGGGSHDMKKPGSGEVGSGYFDQVLETISIPCLLPCT